MGAGMNAEATVLLEALPFSIEMPAGTGKTQLIAAMAAVASRRGEHTLLLTHTNAGVAALRKRLKDFAVAQTHVHIDTIDGWAFELVRHYPELAQIRISATPDWSETPKYRLGAVKVARAVAIRSMHRASFDLLLVDEYQDCNLLQHELILSLARAIPRAAVFGDRLQGIFDFRGEKLVDWNDDVFPHYPLITRDHTPWRWAEHNADLGRWLLELRPQLVSGGTVDFSAVEVPGLTWMKSSHAGLIKAAFTVKSADESVLVLNQWRPDNVQTASRLGGTYSVMEDLNGNFMRAALAQLENLEAAEYARWLAEFAKSCFSGLANINQTVLSRLKQGKSLAEVPRPGLESTMAALDRVCQSPSLFALAEAMSHIERAKEGKLYCTEAWHDSLAAIRSAAEDSEIGLTTRLAQIRDRLRYTGRRRQQRIVSRTVLVKGLEYDHAIVCSADDIGSVRNFYVALTRPRKTLTVMSSTPRIRLR